MRTLLVAINAKYSHTNLALRYLEGITVNARVEVDLKEFTINQNTNYILTEIYKTHADVVCFSCYIWNIEMILALCKTLKKIKPGITIVLGGPEVSYETESLMTINDDIDIVLIGEAERSYKELMNALESNNDYTGIYGVAYRAKGNVYKNKKTAEQFSMEELPFPYADALPEGGRIVYYEASRGCPFNCQYCLSSAHSGVKYLPIHRIKEDLLVFINAKVKQVKFVDRTFNANKIISLEIMKFIVENNNNLTNFHFEITADIMDNEMLAFLKDVPTGLFQFEIGVQSTNEKTLLAIDRKMNFTKISEVVNTIIGYGNIHLHLDLIVGLPHEDYFTFRKTFNDVFALRPNRLQIGFLKLLKGSNLRSEFDKYGYVYTDCAPYEIIQSNDISYGDLICLKGIEEMVEIFWNSRQFTTTISIIIHNYYTSPFNFFDEFYVFWEKASYHHCPQSKNKLYEIIYEFYIEMGFFRGDIILELLKYDYLKNTKTSSLPVFFHRAEEKNFKNKCHEFLQIKNNVLRYIPLYADSTAKQIIKSVHFEQFEYDIQELSKIPEKLLVAEKNNTVILFDYSVTKRELSNSRDFVLMNFENKEGVK
ncbi:MAG: B12-binding domain-containing radical SAM protein [Clostridiales bacterium]|nr:B12-binding domain-containing radical SAM protein [Clostridiales bacterium]